MSISTGKLEQLRKIIKSSEHLVCVIDSNLASENGYPLMQDSDWAYDMELKYDYSPEEIFNSSFYATRRERFFDFYKKEILSNYFEPNESYRELKHLEDEGYIKAIISTDFYSLAKRAGCKNVIEICGSIYNNYCPHCRSVYDIEYIRNSKKVPVCEKCNTHIRPGVFLYGEMIDNQIMTKAMNEVSKADALLLCGTNLNAHNFQNSVQYFNGDKLVIICEKKHYSDEKAFLVINDKVKNVLPGILD